MRASEQPARQANVDAIVGFFESGIKERAHLVGIELEHTVVRRDGSQFAYEGDPGVKQLLADMADEFPDVTRDAAGNILGVANEDGAVTLEPAAQVELSAGPFASLFDARDRFERFERDLEERVGRMGARVATLGYHPTRRAATLALIPKARYRMMNEYLGAISAFGVCMMRGSAATQVAIDYTDVDDCLRKLRLANACVPVFALICDNSPIFEAKPRPHRLMRTEIWQKCDPDRCGTVPGVMEKGFSLDDYAAYILDTPAVFEDADGGPHITERTFGELFAHRPMERADVEHALSLFFTDVRLKTYIEIRPADAMPAAYAVAYAALVKGLFYGAGSLDALDALFADVTARDIDEAKAALMERGYDARVYGHPVSELADELASIAAAGLQDGEGELLRPLAALVAKRTTLADAR